MPRFIIHAINVHRGGGAVLLRELVRCIPPKVEAVVNADARMDMPVDLPAHVRVKYVAPTLSGRIVAECRLAVMVRPQDQVLCFGNLPPLFRLSGKTTVFLHNRYLVDLGASLRALPFMSRLRLRLERAWLYRRRFNAHKYIVQTPSMQRLTFELLGLSVICKPFAPGSVFGSVSNKKIRQSDFIYVASGEPHKNHEALLDAWLLLADDGLFPSLSLTLCPDSFTKLCERIAYEVATGGLRIRNLGNLPHDRILQLYRTSGALIYPSSFESFGLPLVEASQAGLPILASELDYVRDISNPNETFDPSSPVSIARAVKRFLKCRNPTLLSGGAEEFLAAVLEAQRSQSVNEALPKLVLPAQMNIDQSSPMA